MNNAIYVIEHPDHVVTVHYFSPDSEKEEIGTMTREGILWFEKLGITVPGDWSDEKLLAMCCSRPLIPLWHFHNQGEYFMALDHAEQLLAAGSEYNWMSGTQGVRHAFFPPIRSCFSRTCLPAVRPLAFASRPYHCSSVHPRNNDWTTLCTLGRSG
jgi:hypothetical protein